MSGRILSFFVACLHNFASVMMFSVCVYMCFYAFVSVYAYGCVCVCV